MARLLGLGLVAIVLLSWSSAPAQEKKDAPVQITWHGQSFFTIKSSKGTTIAIDPHQITEYGRVMGLKADAILMSHLHNDHTQVVAIENFKDAKIIAGLKGTQKNAEWNLIDEDFKDVHIRSVGLYHDSTEGLRFGKNTAFILEMDGWRIVHLGDLGHVLTPAQLRKLGKVDVLMIPVGGIYTLNGSEAKQVVEQIKPKEYIFPMHRGTKIYTELLPIDEFLDDQEKEKIAISDDNTIILNRDKQRPRPLIVQLHYWPKAGK